jgi:outer membrane receptor protein involved in Fe transport
MTKSVFLLFCAISIAAFADPVKQIDVSPGDLVTALESISKQADVELVFRPEQLRGLRTQGVKGLLSSREAVEQLLKGTALQLRTDESTGAMMIGQAEPAASEAKSSHHESLNADVRFAQAENTAAPSSENQDAQLEEIVVTATKRMERIQDVPLSITAITAEEIDRRRLVSAEDYLRGIPGVNQMNEATGASIVIRGIETSPSNQNFASGTTVATYFGETPTTNSGGLGGNTNVDIKLVDIERVEVLRGPQGTAFGNSSLGGAVRTIPVAPKLDRLEGKVGAGFSATSGTGDDNRMLQAVGNIPLIQDKLALRATAYRFEDSGIYRNVAGSDAAFQSLAAIFGAENTAVNADDVGASTFTGGRIAALYSPSDDLKFTLSYLNQKTEVEGQAAATTGTYDQTVLQVAPEHFSDGRTGGFSDTQIEITNATIEYDLGRVNLLGTFSHLESESVWAGTSLSFVPYSGGASSHHRENSAEIRFTTQLDGPWDFLGGIYAEKHHDEGDYTYYQFGNPLPFNAGQEPFTEPYLGRYLDQRELKQKAAFAEASWEFVPRFTLTGGVRAYDYERRALVTNNAFIHTTQVTDNATDASGTTFRGNLSYKPNDSALLYADWSQGFRLGKPQPGLPANSQCDGNGDGIVDGTTISLESTRSVDSDEVENYELGSKLSLLERRLKIAADIYRIDWIDLPVQSSACGFVFNQNAGSARSEGIEVQVDLQLTPALLLSVGGSRIRAELTSDANLTPVPGVAGDRLPGSPKVNGNLGVQYGFSVAGHASSVRLDGLYVGSFYGNLSEAPNTEAGGYTKLDASARTTIKNLSVDLYVRNITDADDYTFRGISDLGTAFGYRLRPRTFGVQLGYSF